MPITPTAWRHQLSLSLRRFFGATARAFVIGMLRSASASLN